MERQFVCVTLSSKNQAVKTKMVLEGSRTLTQSLYVELSQGVQKIVVFGLGVL